MVDKIVSHEFLRVCSHVYVGETLSPLPTLTQTLVTVSNINYSTMSTQKQSLGKFPHTNITKRTTRERRNLVLGADRELYGKRSTTATSGRAAALATTTIRELKLQIFVAAKVHCCKNSRHARHNIVRNRINYGAAKPPHIIASTNICRCR